MERITAAAETAGAPRTEKVIQMLNRVLGAPEAAGEAVKIAGENITDFKDRTEKRMVEAAMNLAERADNAWSRFTGRVTEEKNKAVAKATELKNKAIKTGVEVGFGIEEKLVKVFESPAALMEKASSGFESKAAGKAGELMRVAAEQAAKEMNLSADQAEQLRLIMERQQAAREAVSARHEAVAEKIQLKIESAKGTAAELKAKASNVREGIDKKRIFKGLLAKLSA
jgi:ribosomal protein L19